ncbi:uncharacterized protein K452DRAFT_234931 [Aplosporella prunicola CBS 121167]|uniref:Histone deacetylase domain-containing protein n=1 Tax=Aplosporella prunicola CBS 121167 TaxID=1176127 RepID=A0A6A6B511_9PEZI|nr:uncharacterized protein K452DRAFT_234931 [Aplosporella prunicola CBS 121167]KAF2138047.1 hypothetical protein K452DRAFT_234931 [Aplosporella prunicola CBS 121167]
MQNDPAPSDPAPAEHASQALNPDNSPRLSKSMKRLSINTAANPPRPDSPSMSSPRRAPGQRGPMRSPTPAAPQPSPLHRSSSSMGNHQRSSSPTLSRRSSIISMNDTQSTSTPRKSSSRRTSNNNHPPGPPTSVPIFPTRMTITIEEPAPPTAQKIAADYFAKELELHKQEETSAQTVVILHDACYGHRFSRQKTTKTALSMIVERPERIHAGILGISTAYVRFGERHQGGPYAPHPDREPNQDLPFRIQRTSRTMDITSQAVTNVHGTKWMEELQTMCNAAGEKLAHHEKELTRPEEAGQPAKEAFHEGDLYLSNESLDAFQGALGGVCDGVDAVFGNANKEKPTNAFVCVRPPGHHCSADFPSGFCWLNNVHVGIEYAALNHGLTHAAIIDFDLHHGDGSQSITWERNSKAAKLAAKQSKNAAPSKKASIGYFSLHDINSYPCEEGDINKVQAASLCIENAHNQTVWNVHLQPWKTEEDFWKLYETRYLTLLEKARVYLRTQSQRLRTSPNQTQPKAAIFISAGFDASEWEGQGMQRHKVNVPTEFYARFTKDIVRMSKEQGLGVDGRVISVLEGGYSERALTSGVLSHLSGLCDGQTRTVQKKQAETNGLGYDTVMGHATAQPEDGILEFEKQLRYNVEWWHESNLTALETLVYPAPPQPIRKQQRIGPRPNFATPTQSFTQKVVDPTKFIKNSSGDWVPIREAPRPPTPPLPDVDWVTAANELSKLLIPTDRPTKSHTAEELAPPRIKKEVMPPPDFSINSGRQLRDRKAKVPNYSELPSDDETLGGGSDRRKTVPPDFLTAPEGNEMSEPLQTNRRLSVASTATSVAGERPSSRASVARQPSGTGMQVKKTRPAKADPSTKLAPRPAVHRPSTSLGTSASTKSTEGGDPMDQLTSGIKKITLKMPTKEEHDARQAAAAEAEKKKPTAAKAAPKKAPASRTTKTSTAAKKSVQKDPKEAETKVEQPDVSKAAAVEEPQPIQNQRRISSSPRPRQTSLEPAGSEHRPMTRRSIEDMGMQVMNSISPELAKSPEMQAGTPHSPLPTNAVHLPTMTPRPDTPPPPPPSTAPEAGQQFTQFVQYTPPETKDLAQAGLGIDGAESQQPAALQWIPPNLDPEAHGAGTEAQKPKQQLPVFTSNGYIPFGPRPGSGGSPNGASPPASVGEDMEMADQQ